nr:serine/threonine-protein kinase [Nannocystis pusilla]
MLGAPNPIVGKYEIIEELGEGAYGTVFCARDGELNRNVAVKVFDETATAETRAAIMAEAKALANFQHAHIVTLYEVASVDQSLYVVMEYVDGTTLARWEAEPGRTWTEILGAYLAAGEGLAQIHARGYIHRDLKPENVLVDGAGNVKVADFGLARRYVDRQEEVAPRDGASSTYFLDSPFSAPELRSGGRATERSDQYAFCAALWLALGGSLLPVRAPPVPRGLVRALSRGLQEQPETRWASMRELLRVLQPKSRRRAAIILSSVLFLIIGLSLGMLLSRERFSVEAACQATRDDLDVLDLDRRRELLDLRFPAEAPRIDEMIDTLRAGYQGVSQELCTLAMGGVTGSEQYLAQRTCLEDVRSRLGAMLSLAETDMTVTAVDVVTLLVDIPQADACRAASEFGATIGDRSILVQIRDIAPLRRRLAEAETLELIRRRREAGDMIEALLPEIHRAGDPRLLSRALTLYGTSLVWRERLGAAADVLKQAYELAFTHKADDIAVEAAAMRTHVLGFKLLRYDEAMASAHDAEVLIERESLPDVYSGRVDIERARISRRKHRIEEALAINRAAVRKLKDAVGPNSRRRLRPMTGTEPVNDFETRC